MTKIRIDDGTKEYKIENQYGREICRVHFRPADLALLDRFEQVSSKLPDALAPLKDKAVRTDGTPANQTDEDWAALKAAEAEIVRQFNELLDSDDIGEVFKKHSAFSVVGGKFFCEVLLEAIGEVITEELRKEAEATQKRLAKYLPEDAQDAGAATADA